MHKIVTETNWDLECQFLNAGYNGPTSYH